jgi:glycosyltransferase involved in cell wall biosynthesis
VFITEHNKGSWNSENGIVVPHGIDMELFSGWEYPSKNNKLYVLYIVNQLEARDYFCGYTEWTKVREKVESQYPDIEFVLVGDNPGLSSPISNEKELSNIIKNCLCYINTTRLSPLPMSLLEAMSCGCPVVSTANQQVPQLINGENGISTNDLDVMASSIIKIYKDRLWAESLGKNARKTIKEKYSLSKFISSWNKIFKQAYDLNLGTGEIGI